MKRNNVLTILFSFCPGAGQMYQGYMKRGVSLITMFLLPLMIGASFMPVLGIFSIIAYMYSFFDSLNLKAQIKEGENLPSDDYLVHFNILNGDINTLISGKNHLVGWSFVFLGVAGIYKSFIEPMLFRFAHSIEGYIGDIILSIVLSIPKLAVAVIFILVGIWLVRGGKKKNNDEIIEYKGEK